MTILDKKPPGGSEPGRWLWLAGYWLSLLLPLSSLAFYCGGPWPWWQALAWTWPVWLLIGADRFSPALPQQPPADLTNRPFDALLWLLGLLQTANLFAMALLVSQTQWGNAAQVADSLANLLAVRILMGTCSCCAAIAPAHELIHRRSRAQRLLGRWLLCSVLYDHFSVVHGRLHHRHVNSGQDPAQARPDESYERFFRRTAALQWRAAWALDRRNTARGVLAEALLLALLGWGFGWLVVAMFVYQAVVAVRLLEAVNYFQHWGLHGRHPLAWECDNAVSLFLFLGLPRHTDHHRHALKPYQRLLGQNAGPRLWLGYLGMAWLVKNRCHCFRKRANEILAASAG
jgi:alkane 1-monooxygenase